MSADLQAWIVAALLLWALVFTLRRYVPAIWQQDLAQALKRRGFARLAQYLAPADKPGCDSGCSACSPACSSRTGANAPRPADPALAVTARPAPVKWRTPSSGACH